jgi:hypothetical protein
MGMTAMFRYKSYDERLPTDTEAYYEAVASQEEIHLEEVEEELRAILIFGIVGDPFPPQKGKKIELDANDYPRIAERLDAQLSDAVEDSDRRRLGWHSTERRGGCGDAENDSNI